MFLDEGIKSVRMDDIATRLGVSKRTLYEIFGDKQNLLEQSLRHHFHMKRDRTMERLSSAENVIEEIFMAIEAMKQNEKDGALVCNLKKFYPDIYLKMQGEAHTFTRSAFEELLDRGIRQGLFLDDMDKDLALITITFTLTALFDKKSANFAPLKDIPPQRAFQYVVVNFFRGLATKKGIEVIDELVEKHQEQKVNRI